MASSSDLTTLTDADLERRKGIVIGVAASIIGVDLFLIGAAVYLLLTPGNRLSAISPAIYLLFLSPNITLLAVLLPRLRKIRAERRRRS